MADALFQTYNAIGNREDLTDIISNISPTDTPMLSRFGRASAKATLHEWQTDALANASGAGVVEGSDVETTALTATTRVNNYCQIQRRHYRVTKTQEAVDKAGRNSELAYQAAKALKELARDMETAIHDNTGNSGGPSAGQTTGARTLKGVRTWITTNISTGTGSGLSTMAVSDLNTHLNKIWTSGGRPNAVYVNGGLKIRISGFTTPNTRYEDAAKKRYTATVNVFDSPFGPVDIVLDRYATASELLALQDDLWRVAYLRPMTTEKLPDGGGGPKGVSEVEYTLEALNEKGSGKMTDWA